MGGGEGACGGWRGCVWGVKRVCVGFEEGGWSVWGVDLYGPGGGGGLMYCRSTIFVGRGENKNMKIYNTIQNSGTVMHFLEKNKTNNDEQ